MSPVKKVDEDPLFQKFWEAYPRRVGKQAARKAWLKLKADEVLSDTIVEAVRRYCLTKQWKDVQFIPHPASFLNGARWEDDIPPPHHGAAIVTRIETGPAVKNVKIIST